MLLSNFRATPLVAKSLSLCLSFPLGFELVFLRAAGKFASKLDRICLPTI